MNNQINLIYSGRLIKSKKVDILINALNIIIKKLNNFFLHVVGDGEEKNNLFSLVKKLGLNNNIKFHGSVYDKKLNNILSKIDIGIIPTSVGLSIIQYFAKGIPCITDDGLNDGYDHGPEVSALINNKTGLFL